MHLSAEDGRSAGSSAAGAVIVAASGMQVATVLSSHPNMGGKSFCAALPLPRNEAGEPAEHVRLAIASSDGTVRVLNGFNPDSVHAAFATKSGSAISAMAVVPIHNRDAVLAGAPPRPHAACPGRPYSGTRCTPPSQCLPLRILPGPEAGPRYGNCVALLAAS